jgi:hypothetical protein
MTAVAILIGLQAAGTTMFYRQRLAGTHRHVSKDLMPHNRNKQRRQLQLITEALDAADNWLHLGLAVVMVGLGLILGRMPRGGVPGRA